MKFFFFFFFFPGVFQSTIIAASVQSYLQTPLYVLLLINVLGECDKFAEGFILLGCGIILMFLSTGVSQVPIFMVSKM